MPCCVGRITTLAEHGARGGQPSVRSDSKVPLVCYGGAALYTDEELMEENRSKLREGLETKILVEPRGSLIPLDHRELNMRSARREGLTYH
jgi:hypothetical protein